jgi:hypothetical protein
LNIVRQLIKDTFVFFRQKCLILIIIPFIIEMFLNSFFNFFINRLIIVELLENSEEAREFVPVVEICHQNLEGGQDVYEVAHDVREDGDTEEQDESAEDALGVGSRVEVAEADS